VNQRFSKASRIREPQNFRRLLAAREKISSPYFSIKYRSNFLAVSRLGIALPKKKFAAPSTATV
jgi:RNase P protein component